MKKYLLIFSLFISSISLQASLSAGFQRTYNRNTGLPAGAHESADNLTQVNFMDSQKNTLELQNENDQKLIIEFSTLSEATELKKQLELAISAPTPFMLITAKYPAYNIFLQASNFFGAPENIFVNLETGEEVFLSDLDLIPFYEKLPTTKAGRYLGSKIYDLLN